VLCFLKFGERIGVSYDTCSDMIVEVSIFVNQSSDCDIELRLTVEAQEANRASIKSAGDGLKLSDDFGGSFLWGPSDRASRETRGEGGEWGVFWSESAPNC
jgi:hypothetical protein